MFLASPLRRLLQDPGAIVQPYVQQGMTVLEPGPGMGFFTVELARRVGSSGRVVAVDVQPRMIAGLKRRLARVGLLERVEARIAPADSLGLADLRGEVDFTLAGKSKANFRFIQSTTSVMLHNPPKAKRLCK